MMAPMTKVNECNLGRNRTYDEVMGGFLPALEDFYKNPSAYNIEPFRIFGNLYYVGDKKVCMHLIDTGNGCILFDSGYSHNYHSLISSIKKLGFSPYDVKILIHSHAHFDHIGGGDRMREQFGTQIYMSEVDTNLTREMPERALMHLAPGKEDTFCYPDVTIKDGDVITLGNTSIKCVLSPGHTPGTMSFFFDATDGSRTLRVGYWGGVGFLTLYREYIKEYRLPSNMLEVLGQTTEMLRTYNVDIFLGNHPNHNCTLEKRAYMLEHENENPFINPRGWQIFLDAVETRRLAFKELGY